MKRADKPLYVQVHEALGHKVRLLKSPHVHRHWEVFFPDDDDGPDDGWLPCARFDTDWASGGPLIARFRIGLSTGDGWLGGSPLAWTAWKAMPEGSPFVDPVRIGTTGETPLVAVCRLILELAKEGKL